MTLLSSLLLSLILTIVLTPVFSRLAMRLNLYDVPDARKVHQWPVPRIGGLAIAIGAFASIVLWAPLGNMLRAYLLGASILVAVGIVDDWKGLDFRAKFIGQLAAALIAVFYGGIGISKLGALLPEGMILPQAVMVALTVVTIVGVTNAINLSDGLDGLAGGISMLGFACIGYLAFLEQNLAVAIPAAALVGALFGFLRFNTHPATLFMGDTGSLLLGFSAAFFSLALTQGDTALSPLLPLIILGFPILDTLTVMGERVAEMKVRYPERYLFFDVPPVLAGDDALAFAPLVDWIILVVQAGKTPMPEVNRALQMLPREKILGLILNRQTSQVKAYPYQ
jgi:UDP-GlcNAc:undecaprenyl-phosphate GlcNAc-1-phosphate transferase